MPSAGIENLIFTFVDGRVPVFTSEYHTVVECRTCKITSGTVGEYLEIFKSATNRPMLHIVRIKCLICGSNQNILDELTRW
jgi:hypothetical protein